MRIGIILAFVCIASGCDVRTSSAPGDGERSCEVEGFESSLSTTVDELEGKSGDDLVKLTQLTVVAEIHQELTDEELVEFYNKEDNFAKTPHEIPFSRIIKCRTTEELMEYYLEKN